MGSAASPTLEMLDQPSAAANPGDPTDTLAGLLPPGDHRLTEGRHQDHGSAPLSGVTQVVL